MEIKKIRRGIQNLLMQALTSVTVRDAYRYFAVRHSY